MVSSTSIFVSGALLGLLSSLVSGGSQAIQIPGLVVPGKYQQNLGEAKNMFEISYKAYHAHAFGHDTLLPLSNSYSDDLNGWGATIVDALDTMYIMGMNTTDSFLGALNFVSSIDYSKSKTSDPVSVFETTIRHLGGLLSTYELSGKQYPGLLKKAKELADKMAFAWVGNNDIPFGHLHFSNNTPAVATSNIAEAGTLTLEWAVLSKYTGNDTYGQLVEKSVRHMAQGPSPLPGLPAQGINPHGGTPVGGYVTWGGGSDSYFEYLIKYARLNNSLDNIFADTWHLAADSSIRTLLKTSTSASGTNYYLADYDNKKQIRHVGSHLACFHGGNWLLGGRLLGNDTIFNIGLELVNSCWNTYASTATGIGPEAFAFESLDGTYTGDAAPTADQSAFNSKHGFYITASDYILRPEVLESNFYAWRATGDTKYLDRAASAIQSFNQYLSSNEAYAGIDDVNSMSSARIDNMESFWFGEVLKYLYLTFDDPSHISLNEYVFNTECHPFKAPPQMSQYGSKTLPPTPTGAPQPFAINQGSSPVVSSPASLNQVLHL